MYKKTRDGVVLNTGDYDQYQQAKAAIKKAQKVELKIVETKTEMQEMKEQLNRIEEMLNYLCRSQ